MDRLPLADALAAAEKIKAALAPLCDRIDIAGSIRRKRPLCGDIDIVCLPRPGKLAHIHAFCHDLGDVAKSGKQYVMVNFDGDTQLDLWFAHHEVSGDPCNYGAIFLTRTGSISHNIKIVERAKQLGLRYHPHKGVMHGERVVASAEEADIFKALNMAFVAPELREVGGGK